MWRSWLARRVWDAEAGGSSPLTPTKKMKAYYLLRKSPLPVDLSKEIQGVLSSLGNNKGNETYLKAAYNVITTRYQGGRIKTFSRLLDLFSTSTQDLWNRMGFLHCTNQNFLLSLLLVRSGRFQEKDIKPKWTLMWFLIPHQYLRINLGSKVANVDPWAKGYGVPFGQHAKGFNSSIKRAKD